MGQGITQTQLDNGLTVVLQEVHSAPVISWWIVYRVGSRNEPTGKTGISHWLEHMLFKGTEKYPQGVLDRLIDRSGGQWNAFTTTDYTTYYATLPADRIDLALDAEADRMMEALFDPEETEAERNVVIAERHDNENSPTFWLNEAMRATAFMVHGYHHEIIGDMTDLETMPREALLEHYHRYYVPSNATVIAVGAFDTDDMLKKIENYYGALPLCESPELFVRPEPPQQGERRLHIERPGQTAFVRIAHRVPPALHDDWFKLELLDSILSGPGGGVDNKTSRLYGALVKTGIAASLGGGLQETIDPYLYTIGVKINDGHTHAETEKILLHEIDRIKEDGITEHELKRAKKQAVAAFAYSTESVTNQAYWLAQGAALGDVHWLRHYLQRLKAVTLEDVKTAAQQYLVPQQRTVGWLIPVPQERA